MPKSRSSNNNTTSSTSSTSTIKIYPTILHLNRPSSSSSSSSTSGSSHYIHNTSYGLVEPAQNKRPVLHHRRKSSGSTSSSSSWSDRGFDLTELKDKSVDLGEKLSERLPGVRYSAAFISSLRANLALSASLAPPSPNLQALSSNTFPTNPFTCSQSRTMVLEQDPDPLADIPDLTFSPPTTPEDKTSGLKLVADIYTQQKTAVSTSLIYNPITPLIYAILVGCMYPLVYKDPAKDKPSLFLALVAMLSTIFVGVRVMVKPYQELVEKINWDWLGEDDMIVAKYGETVIGSAVYKLEGLNGGKKAGTGKKMLIRAWTVRPRERKRGVGKGLLEYIVETAKTRGCSGVEFAPDEIRAGSERLLREFDGFAGIVHVNRQFDREDAKARECLEGVLNEKWEKKRRGSR